MSAWETQVLRQALNLPTGEACGDPRFLVELAVEAERAGWDAVLLEDYIVYQGRDVPTCDPWVALAAIAVRTERVRIGTGVTPLARRRPWRVAQEVATIDHLSGGRAILGVGAGDPLDATFALLGEETDLRRRAEMLDEALAIVAGLWRGERLTFHGEHYDVDGLAMRLTPAQKPRVPIWVGGHADRGRPVARAARWDGAMLGFKGAFGPGEVEIDPDELARLVEQVRRLRPQGLAGFDFVMGGRRRRPDEGAEKAWLQRMAAAGATWWMEWIPPGPPAEMRAAVRRGPLLTA